jgi:hypothetical protein
MPPLRDVLHLCATRVAPLGFVLGASMEAFMYATGFWSVATRKASERDAEARAALRGAGGGGGGDGGSGGGARAAPA